MNPSPARGMPTVARSNYAAAFARPRPVRNSLREATAARTPVRDGADPVVQLALAVAARLLEAITDDERGDPDAAAQADLQATGSDELDRMLFPALTCLALGLLGRQARHRPADSARFGEVAALLGEESRPPLPLGEPAWPDEPLTRSETRVLRYLPSHLSVPEIAAELCLSASTVKTHKQHLYRKLGAHSRDEAVRRARAIGLLAASRGP